MILLRSPFKCFRLLAGSFSTKNILPYTGKPYETIRADRQYIFPFYSHHYYKEPFLAVQAQKDCVYDQNGKEYVDLIGGISCMNIGHSHPRITEIYKSQSQKLSVLSSHYTNEFQGAFAEKLVNQLGNGLDTVFFFNSGSQSNDFAFNMAKAYSKSNTIVSLRNAYHGTAGNSMSLTSIGTWNSILPRAVDVQRLAWPNLYRSSHTSIDSLIKDAQEQLDANTNGKIAGFWAEPIMGAGGINPLTPQYAQRMYALVKKMNGLFVADQVQTGFGRIGEQTWGFKWLGVKPDIVITAKAIANGYPFSAVITRRQIAEAITHNYFPPYAGGPMQCRIAMEVLDIIREEKLAENSEKVGKYLLKQFKRIQQKCKYIGDVRGKGMMIGVEFVKTREGKEPGIEQMSHVMEKGREAGVLFGKGGYKGNLIRILGPLCLSMSHAKKAIDVFEHATDSLK